MDQISNNFVTLTHSVAAERLISRENNYANYRYDTCRRLVKAILASTFSPYLHVSRLVGHMLGAEMLYQRKLWAVLEIVGCLGNCGLAAVMLY